jgi:hypothetical protein
VPGVPGSVFPTRVFSRLYRVFPESVSSVSVLTCIPGVPGIRIQRERSHVYTGRSRNIISIASVSRSPAGRSRLRQTPPRVFSRLYRVFPDSISDVSVLTYLPGVPGSSSNPAQNITPSQGIFSRTAIRESRRAANLRHPPSVRRPLYVPRRSSPTTAIIVKRVSLLFSFVLYCK